MSIREAYTDWSNTYDQDRNLTRDLDLKVTTETLAKLEVGVAIEIGCGTGKNTPLLVGISERVVAIDFSEGMIRRARQKLSASNVTFAVADITDQWPLKAEHADLVVCNLVLEHIHDLYFVTAEAFRVLGNGGHFFVCELHPYRQYQGTKARFERGSELKEIPAFVHHLSDFLVAAESSGLTLRSCREWWHEEDHDKPPRLVSFMFEKRVQCKT